MLIVALVLAVIGLAALVTAVVTSNELIAWVCIAASVIGVVLLIVDALRERSASNSGDDDSGDDDSGPAPEDTSAEFDADYPEDAPEDVPEVAPEDAEAETTAAAVETADDEVAGEDHKTR